ncbi:NAD(P)-dependent oxidoreductase [Rhodoplanes sp. Z2-YC6860]|uniref:NAD(P)-dependent oxidoreductase n=1 Tax=Rhodoplanes sp. Z2-YC6860 TaxID=674703 RepID=UPI00078CAC99|nr:NAD(P)-dependent oxidoreductase [Rhodoplanes sp. Z2-YC6860]AMN38537.1 beta-hydroxyacid dehydrogenase, 3-hydroxyisobutyrate dehydrogenase [Rhodoplanes sp. Z2-YC6860]
MNPTVAVIAQGAMGAGIGGRLVERGLKVVTSLAGRSEGSAKRAAAAGMVAVSDAECAKADVFLSILPPSDALPLAEKMAAMISASNHKPIYVDCNAVSPPTKVQVGEIITRAGSPFVDVGIIGLPPKPGSNGPVLIVSGPDSAKLVPLGDFGLNLRVVEGPVGAASAVKMSYAGITKGITALGSMMMLASMRGGVGEELRAQLERSHPYFMQNFTRAVPEMFDKAYRFVGEMEEIADFVGEDPQAKQMYLAFADFYRRMAADVEGENQETDALRTFLKPKQ